MASFLCLTLFAIALFSNALLTDALLTDALITKVMTYQHRINEPCLNARWRSKILNQVGQNCLSERGNVFKSGVFVSGVNVIIWSR